MRRRLEKDRSFDGHPGAEISFSYEAFCKRSIVLSEAARSDHVNGERSAQKLPDDQNPMS